MVLVVDVSNVIMHIGNLHIMSLCSHVSGDTVSSPSCLYEYDKLMYDSWAIINSAAMLNLLSSPILSLYLSLHTYIQTAGLYSTIRPSQLNTGYT